MTNTKLEAEICFAAHKPDALRLALEYAGEDGFVASMPQLMHARAHADYENIIWNTWFTAHSEESVVTSPQGNHVVVVIHGGGIYGKPERFERMLFANKDEGGIHGWTDEHAGKVSSQEARDILEGRLRDGTELPIYSFDDFRQGIADLPSRYGVTLDFELARQSLRGYETFDSLKEDPNMIARAGGVEANIAYLDRYQARHGTTRMGNWHPYNRIDPDQSQTRVMFLAGNDGQLRSEDDDFAEYGYDCDYGLGGDAYMGGMARYVAVAPRDSSTSLRFVPFRS